MRPIFPHRAPPRPPVPDPPAAGDPSREWRGFLRRLLTGVVVINLAVAALTLEWGLENRRQREEMAAVTAQNLSRVLDENIVSTIDEVDLSLLVAADEAERQLAAGGLDGGLITAILARLRARQPDIDGLRVADAEGRLIYGDGITPATHATIADRGYYLRLREEPMAGLVISEPVIGRVSGKQVVILARRIEQPDGGFAGVVLASVALDHLANRFADLDVGPRGEIALIDLRLRVLARHAAGSAEASAAVEPDLAEAVAERPAGGLFLGEGPADRVQRLHAYRRVAPYPFYVLVGLASADYLADWWREAARLAALQGVILALTLLFAWLLGRSSGRQRKAVERLLRQGAQLRSERNFNQQLIRTAHAIVLVLDAEGRIVFFNRFLEELTGWRLEEVKGRDWFEIFVPPAERDRLRGPFSAAAPARSRGAIHPLITSDGRTLFIEWYDDLLRDEQQQASALLAIGLDVTGRLRGEEVLRERTGELKEAQRLAHIGSWSWLNEPERVFWSEELFRIMGLPPAAEAPAIGWVLERFGREEREEVQRRRAHTLATGEPFAMDACITRADGESCWISIRGEAKRDRQGAVVGLIGTVQEITERRQVTERLTRLNRFYSVMSRVNEMIVRVRERTELFTEICRIPVEEGGFLMAWIGLTQGEGERVEPLVWWGREEGYLAAVQVVTASDAERGRGPTGTAIREGITVVCSDMESDPRMGPWREEARKRGYRSSAAAPIRENGRVVGAYTIYAAEPHFFSEEIVRLVADLANDISFAVDYIDHSRFRAEAELQLRSLNESLEQRVAERTRQLEAANRELQAFSYSVSHDLRAPLRSIDGFSRMLETRYGDLLDATGKEYLERVRNAVRRMGGLIDDLLTLAQLSRTELQRGTVDLSALAREVAQTLQESAPARRVQWVIEAGVTVHADAGLMRLVLENLLGNAWKFTSRNESARIEFGAAEREGERVILVRDNGAGFDMRYAGKLFGAFQRLHSHEEFEGTGIGLATVQRIVNRHGGRIWAEGEPGRGAVFYFVV